MKFFAALSVFAAATLVSAGPLLVERGEFPVLSCASSLVRQLTQIEQTLSPVLLFPTSPHSPKTTVQVLVPLLLLVWSLSRPSCPRSLSISSAASPAALGPLPLPPQLHPLLRLPPLRGLER